MSEVIKNKDLPNAAIIAEFNESLKPVLEKEKMLWARMVGFLRDETLSVRGTQATIEVVNAESGSLPTIAVTAVQYFLAAAEIYDSVDGAEIVPLFDLLNVTIQGTRKTNKKRFSAIVKDAKNFDALRKTVENLPKKPSAQSEPKIKGVDNILKALSEALEAEDFSGILKDPDMADAVSKQLTACAKLTRTPAHPAVMAKLA
jgi:hypothetical protein